MRGRRIVICVDCNKEKTHYGLNRCSACLRQMKRRTRPGFYLGTQYSEIKRRCTTKTKDRLVYFGKEFCTKYEFINRFINDINFLKQYKKWQRSGFKRKTSPSIDRINNKKGYTVDNLQTLSHAENSSKDKKKKIIITRDGKLIKRIESQIKTAKFFNLSPAQICNILNGKAKNNTGYGIERDNS
jgi:hypothetical protein